MPEYITKAQVIEVAESLRNIAGDTITNAFIKGIEGLEEQGPHIIPEKLRTDAWIERDPYTLRKLKRIYFTIDRTYSKEEIEVALREAMQCVFDMEE